MISAHKTTITRAELFDLVWDKPMTKVGLYLGISDVAVRKICVRHNIPRPPQGHWASTKRRRQRPKLPASADGVETISIHVTERLAEAASKPAIPEPIPLAVQQAISKGPPKRLDTSLAESYKELNGGHVDRYGYLRARYGVSTHDVVATKRSLRRAFNLLAYIKRVCEAGGYTVESRESHRDRGSPNTSIYRDQIAISLRIKSQVRQVDIQRDKSDWGPKYEYADTGMLVVCIGGSVVVKESNADRLEDKLEEIYRKIEREFRSQEQRIRKRNEDILRFESLQRAREIESAIDSIKSARIEDLMYFKSEMLKADENRRYLSALDSQNELTGVDGFEEWQRWSRGVLDVPLKEILCSVIARHRALSEMQNRLRELDADNIERCEEVFQDLNVLLAGENINR